MHDKCRIVFCIGGNVTGLQEKMEKSKKKIGEKDIKKNKKHPESLVGWVAAVVWKKEKNQENSRERCVMI